MTKAWSEKEIKSLLKILTKHTALADAMAEHNRTWKTLRAPDSARDAFIRRGMKPPSAYLKIPESLKEAVPEDKQITSLITYCKGHPKAEVTEICNYMDLSPRRLADLIRIARWRDYRIDIAESGRVALLTGAPPIDRLTVHALPMEPVKDFITIAATADPHFASRLHRNECFKDYIAICYNDYHVRKIFISGDLFAGINMYKGQLNEITTPNFEEQVIEGANGMPVMDGLEYAVIGGNHDEAFMKSCGADIISALRKARPDIKSYGWYSGLFDLSTPSGEKLKVELHHPSQAGSYAISYFMQKEIEQMPPGMKPQVIFMGHSHQSLFLPDYRGVAGLYCGTFEEQTLLLKRKHIGPHLGGWICRIGVTANGSIKSFGVTYIRYFHSRRGPILSGGERYDKKIGLPVNEPC